MEHTIVIEHHRRPLTFNLGEHSESSVSVSAESKNLVEAFREALSRMPSDLYQALVEAMA